MPTMGVDRIVLVGRAGPIMIVGRAMPAGSAVFSLTRHSILAVLFVSVVLYLRAMPRYLSVIHAFFPP